MKTNHILFCLVQFLTCSIITWKAESTLFAVLTYIVLIVLLKGIGKNLLNKLDG
ncbi:MAG: hypothetical protein WKI04_10735 [Ferruginibacter sp.]